MDGMSSVQIQDSTTSIAQYIIDIDLDFASSALPFPLPFSGILNFLFSVVSDQNRIIEEFVRESVDREMAKTYAEALVDNMMAVNQTLNEMLNRKVPVKDRADKVEPVLLLCNVLHNHFKNEGLPFYGQALASTPLLISFATLYITVGRVSVALKPYDQNDTMSNLEETVGLLGKYKDRAIQQRLDMVSQGAETQPGDCYTPSCIGGMSTRYLYTTLSDGMYPGMVNEVDERDPAAAYKPKLQSIYTTFYDQEIQKMDSLFEEAFRNVTVAQ
jgi:hypothetical protein